jgi:hypothetical protein
VVQVDAKRVPPKRRREKSPKVHFLSNNRYDNTKISDVNAA